MTRKYNPSIKTISARLNWLSAEQVKLVRGLIDGSLEPTKISPETKIWVQSHYYVPTIIEQIMHAVDWVIQTNGVEAIYTDHDNSLNNPSALYCNTGETYAMTVIYCYKQEKFLITSWGDYYAANG